MKTKLKIITYWLLLGPLAALLLSFLSRTGLNHLSPDKLSSLAELVSAYPMGLFMSLLTPWGWLMYGGLILMMTDRIKIGVRCTLGGALLLGCFWPIWATFLVQ